ncbi:hypothetical protein BH11ACT6_BH11ACT6_29880 [soil metagenome]
MSQLKKTKRRKRLVDTSAPTGPTILDLFKRRLTASAVEWGSQMGSWQPQPVDTEHLDHDTYEHPDLLPTADAHAYTEDDRQERMRKRRVLAAHPGTQEMTAALADRRPAGEGPFAGRRGAQRLSLLHEALREQGLLERQSAHINNAVM